MPSVFLTSASLKEVCLVALLGNNNIMPTMFLMSASSEKVSVVRIALSQDIVRLLQGKGLLDIAGTQGM